MLQPPIPSLKFVGDTLLVSALFGLVTLTFDFLTSNLVRVIARWGGQPLYQFWCFLDFYSRLMGQQLSDPPRDLATLTFDLGDYDACRWYGSSCYVCVPSLKLVGLPFRKIWHTFLISGLIGLMTLTFMFSGYSCEGFHHAYFGLPRPFELGRGTRQTDRRTDIGHHFIIPLSYGVHEVSVLYLCGYSITYTGF